MLNKLLYGKNRLSILIYHRVNDQPTPVDSMCKEAFDWQMELLAKQFSIVSLSEGIDRLKEGTLPDNAVTVTFDDGYRDNLEIALPILKKWDIPATFFIATGYLNGGIMWNDMIIESLLNTELKELNLEDLGFQKFNLSDGPKRVNAIMQLLPVIKYLEEEKRIELAITIADRAESKLPNDLMLTDEGVREMDSAGMTIGAHTVHHPILAKLPEQRVYDEIEQSKTYLENLLKKNVDLFAYPNGKAHKDYSESNKNQIAEIGFKAACSTEWGVAHSKSDLFQLPRFTPWDMTPSKFSLRLKMQRHKKQYTQV